MKKFIDEYKATRSKSETDKNKDGERVTVTTHLSPVPSSEDHHSQSLTQIGTIRTEEYKRDLAEFQARRSTGGNDDDYQRDLLEFRARHVTNTESDEYKKNLAEFQARRSQKDDQYDRDLAEFQARRSLGRKEAKVLPDTPVKRKCGRHSLPISCTDCTAVKSHDNTFNYEKNSANKYKKKTQKRAKSSSPDMGNVGNIQFLFQNQVFMPGNVFATSTYSEPYKSKRPSRKMYEKRSPEFSAQRRIDFKVDNQDKSPMFYQNNSLPYDSKQFLNLQGVDDFDGSTKDHNDGSQSSSDAIRDEGTEDKLWEVMSELKQLDQWADDQLRANATKSDDNKSDSSACGLPIASASDLEVASHGDQTWSSGRWGMVPVQVKTLKGVNLEMVQKKLCSEVDILRKCRHPNIILLMGLYQNIRGDLCLICEECVDSLYSILHVQGRILSAQTSVNYTLDIANALVFLLMQGYLVTALTSHAIMVTAHDAAKLADVTSCESLPKATLEKSKGYDMYSPEPMYVNIDDTRETLTLESEPLLSQHSSETYLASNAVTKPYKFFRDSANYRWQAPELFVPDGQGMVHPCARSEVYSLSLILWECCNAAIPWKSLTYEKLHDVYTLWQTGIRLPQDGTYPGSLLDLLQRGLRMNREDRMHLTELQITLYTVKRKLDDLEYIIIPARLPQKKSNFSSAAWDTNTTDSECLSPVLNNIEHKAVVHNKDSSSDKDSKTSSPRYETTETVTHATFTKPEVCYIPDEDERPEILSLKYHLLPENDFSSACSTPITKTESKIKDISTPGALHRSDSTEYCSIMSPEGRNFSMNNTKDPSVEKSASKLSRSFTPQSYKPLHITVPQCNWDSVKTILKDQSSSEKSTYNFDIKDYSLPSTPIARSNTLRRNAWLSGDVGRKSSEKLITSTILENGENKSKSAPETPATSNHCFDKEPAFQIGYSSKANVGLDERSARADSEDLNRDSFTGLRKIDRPVAYTPEADDINTKTWTFRRSDSTKLKMPEDALANVNVAPLVTLHERWIHEANKKTGRAMSLPDENRCKVKAVKPASHCVEPQNSLPSLNLKRSVPRPFRTHPVSPSGSGKNGNHWEHFCQTREAIAKSISFSSRDDRFASSKENGITEKPKSAAKIDQSTDTHNIEEFIRELIRKEFRNYLHEISDDGSTTPKEHDDPFNKRVANIVENLKNGEEENYEKKDLLTSFSRVKINGNNKPLLQITFNRTGANRLQVLDNCVNVTLCNSSACGKDKMNVSLEDTPTEEAPVHSLKRCQAFSAIQDARSTEDLYIDDDLSTHMQENFGGKVKLIPLHGSLHEILCEREDECCLIKVKQENGCDSIYFKCDNSDTESRDAIDAGCFENQSQDTVVFKRSISLVEERIQRIFPIPKENSQQRRVLPLLRRRVERKTRPKSEVYIPTITEKTRVISSSSPSLIMKDARDEVEVNLENTMCYQDSSSDECLGCHLEKQESDDFELLEKSIEEDCKNEQGNMVIHPILSKSNVCLPDICEENLDEAGNGNMPGISGCLAKISEENLSLANEDVVCDLNTSRETV